MNLKNVLRNPSTICFPGSDMSSPVATIDRLAFGGQGVCRIDGKVCFVPYSCPGDVLALQVTSEKKSFCTARITNILKHSPSRTQPVCPWFSVCGGCDWQHISYSVQLEQKWQIFADALWRGARVSPNSIAAIVAAPQEYQYRSRVQFKVTVQRGTLQIGFFRPGSHVVTDIVGGCPLAVPAINRVLEQCRSVLATFFDVRSITEICVDAGELGVVAVIRYTGKHSKSLNTYLLERVAEFDSCSGLFLQQGEQASPVRLWGIERISYSLPAPGSIQKRLLMTYLPGGFAQINRLQNEAMLSVIRKLANFDPSENLLDLYCGNGNFSIPLAAEVASVVGMEGYSDSIKAAGLNRSANSANNVEFICKDVRIGINEIISGGRRFTSVLLDPPRAGADGCIPAITALKPHKIIYVSCDPVTLARDIALFQTSGYCVIMSIPLDMFPQTYHLESVTLLIPV